MGFINKLDGYDTELPLLPIQQGLFEDTLTIHTNYNPHEFAISVLVEHAVSLDRGLE